MFEMRIFLFGKSKNIFIIEEAKPEKKLTKWFFIFIIEYTMYFVTIYISFIIYEQGALIFSLFVIEFLCLGFIITLLIFKRLFTLKKSKIREKKI